MRELRKLRIGKKGKLKAALKKAFENVKKKANIALDEKEKKRSM